MSQVILFDFDGTLADSSSIIRRVYNEMAKENGWPLVNEAEYQRLRGMKLSQVFHWIGLKSWQVPKYTGEALKRFRRHSAEIKLFNGLPDLIKQLAASGKKLYVLSANNPKTIKEVLGRYEITNEVTVLRRSALFSKDYAIRRLLVQHKYPRESVWMIGDEVRDIEAAKRAKVKIAAVAWGLQSKELLQTATPDALVTKPSELLSVLSH